jgi:uncharacterized protein (DUF2235 family)
MVPDSSDATATVAATAIAGRNLVVCCDGTGNLWQPGTSDSNVVLLFKALRQDDPDRQIAYYDPGVGTPDGSVGTSASGRLFSLDTLSRVGGLAWGDGVWANVAQAYGFLCEHYQPGDRLFLFGFSRGAFTVRAVSGLIDVFGLLRPDHVHMLPTLLRLYRHPGPDPRQLKASAAEFRERFCLAGVPVHFIGVWDTVETVGMGQVLGLGTRNQMGREVKDSYRHVRHAVALDELRWTFLPRLYQSPVAPLGEGRSFRQVWFRGGHSDVGGGYAQAGLSTIALQWMAGQAHDLGLWLDLPMLARLQGDPCGTLHSEVTLSPPWALVGVFQRKVEVRRDAVHASVRARAAVCGPQRVPLPPDMPEEPRHPLEHWTMPAAAPAPAGQPVFQRPPRWVLPAWLVCMALLAGSIGNHWGGQGVSLAWGQQLGLHRTHGWDLGQSLLDWSKGDWQAVVTLLRMDQFFVVLYTAALMLTVALWLQVPARCYPQEGNGKRLARVMLPLAIADLLENQFTLWALALVTPPDPTPGWWSHSVLVVLVTCLETLVSAGKFALLGALLVLLLQMLLAWRPPRAAPRPVQG